MNERVVPGPVQDGCGIREAVCIHTKKIYDSCPGIKTASRTCGCIPPAPPRRSSTGR